MTDDPNNKPLTPGQWVIAAIVAVVLAASAYTTFLALWR